MCPQLACTPSTGPHASTPIKIHPVLLTQSTPLLIYVLHSSSKSPSFAMLFQGGVLCSPLVVYVWCFTPSLRLVFTPPTANAYTTRSCYARLPARFGHIILSCGGQFEGNRGRGIFDRTISLRSVRDNRRGSRKMKLYILNHGVVGLSASRLYGQKFKYWAFSMISYALCPYNNGFKQFHKLSP